MNSFLNLSMVDENSFKINFVRRLRIAIDESHHTQTRIAELIGVRDATVSDWLNLKKPNIPRFATTAIVRNRIRLVSS